MPHTPNLRSRYLKTDDGLDDVNIVFISRCRPFRRCRTSRLTRMWLGVAVPSEFEPAEHGFFACFSSLASFPGLIANTYLWCIPYFRLVGSAPQTVGDVKQKGKSDGSTTEATTTDRANQTTRIKTNLVFNSQPHILLDTYKQHTIQLIPKSSICSTSNIHR